MAARKQKKQKDQGVDATIQSIYSITFYLQLDPTSRFYHLL
jgi:hypothetical protein